MTIFQLSRDKPVALAARELRRYLGRMTSRKLTVKRASAYDPSVKGVWVGPAAAFGKAAPARLRRDRHPLDDAVFVDARGGHAVVAGANARSVLFAAYRYLEDLGCRWLRPGPRGERVPISPGALKRQVRIDEAPSYRHRCVCIEGACSKRHVVDMIDYAAKRGMNAYFLQFRTAHTFFDRWYTQELPPSRRPRRYTVADSAALRRDVKREVLRRGMILHAVGHGWTMAPFGIQAEDWSKPKAGPPKSARPHLAKVDGRRDYWRGTPINTNLCLSGAKTRSMVAQAVVDYAAEHADEQVVHVWLADGSNNTCECARCRGDRPSDLYVKLLNEIDESLTQRGLDTRIVFLAYVDLLWAPQRERVVHPDRFILMFAPITRSYSYSFLEAPEGAEKVGPYRRNKLVFPRSPRANLDLLAGWRKAFGGECVDFDYHLWSGHRNDPAQMQLAAVLHKDLRDLGRLGMDGFISCQIQRVAFPTGLYQHVVGRTLWDRRAPYSRLVEEYFRDVFGPRGREVRAYLERLSRLFDPPFLRGERPGAAALEKALANFDHIGSVIEAFAPTIKAGCTSKDAAAAAAWRVLRDHAWYAARLARLHAMVRRGEAAAEKAYRELCLGLERRLGRLHPVLDTHQVREDLKRILDRRR